MAHRVTIGGGQIDDVLFGPSHFISRRYDGTGDIIYARSHTPVVTDSTPSLPFQAGASTDVVLTYAHWLRIASITESDRFSITMTDPVQDGDVFRTTLTITTIETNDIGNLYSEIFRLTFDDMATVTLTITQRDAGQITAIQGIVDGVASATPTVSHVGTGFSVRVTGEAFAQFRLTETDASNIATIDTSTIYTIPQGATFLDIPVPVSENNGTGQRTFSVGATNALVAGQVLAQITVTQAGDSQPSLNIGDLTGILYGSQYTLAGTITDGNEPFTTILSSSSSFTSPISPTRGGTTRSVEWDLTQSTALSGNSMTWYGRTTDTDGNQHDTSPTETATVSFLALAATVTAPGALAWDGTTATVTWTSTYGGTGTWTLAGANGTASTPVYNNVTGTWSSTITFAANQINEGIVSRGVQYQLSYSNGSYSVNNVASFIVVHNARPLADCLLIGGAPTLSSADTQAVLTVQFDITQSITSITDPSTTDTDFLNIMNFTNVAATNPTGDVAAVGGGTIPARFAQRRQLTLTGSQNTGSSDRSDQIQINIS